MLIAFVLGGWLHAQGQEALARYVDPVLTVGLVLVTLPVPYRLGREALSQLLAQSPPAEQRARVDLAVGEVHRHPARRVEVRPVASGVVVDEVVVEATPLLLRRSLSAGLRGVGLFAALSLLLLVAGVAGGVPAARKKLRWAPAGT